MPESARTARERLVLILASGLGLGYSPVMPGTCGSLLGPPLAWAMQRWLPIWGYVLSAVVLIALGVPLCTAACRALGRKDPGLVVYDEIAAFPVVFGPLVALEIEIGWLTALIGFVAFRVFDILKVPPAARLERLPDGPGVMADDLVAALYAAGVVAAAHWIDAF